MKNLILWAVIATVVVMVLNKFDTAPSINEYTYSEFVSQVKSGQVETVTVDGPVIIGRMSDGSSFETVRPELVDLDLVNELLGNGVVLEGKKPESQSIWTQLLVASFPILVIIVVFMFFMRQMQGGGGGGKGPMSFGKSKARLLSEDQIKTTFADVAVLTRPKKM